MKISFKKFFATVMVFAMLIMTGCGNSDSSTSKSNSSGDLSLGGLTLGSSIDNMHSVLGQENSSTVDSENYTRYKYDDIEVVTNNGVVNGLVSYSDKVKTEKGLHQGSSLQDVLKEYGKDYVITELEGMALYEYPYEPNKDNGVVMRFAVINNVVDYISLRTVDNEEKSIMMASLKANKSEKSSDTSDTSSTSSKSTSSSQPTLVSLEDESNKAAIREYLEQVNPFFIKDFYKLNSGIIGPLANADKESLKDYAWVMGLLAQDSSNVPKGAEKVARFVKDYFAAEAKIASGYYKIKKDDDGILAKITGMANTGIGYVDQSKAEEEIQKLINWSGAKVYNSLAEATIKGFVNLFTESNRTPSSKSSGSPVMPKTSTTSTTSTTSNTSNTTPVTKTDSDVDQARNTFLNYHKAITNKNYREAYDTLSYAQKERVGDFNSYTEGYVNTISSEVSNIKLRSSEGVINS